MKYLLLVLLSNFVLTLTAQVYFTITPAPETHQFQVEMSFTAPGAVTDVTMPAWTPGYYQMLHFGNQVSDFRATQNQQPLAWTKLSEHTWRIGTLPGQRLTVAYTVTTTRAFVAQPYVDSARAYIVPTGVCMFPQGQLQTSIELDLRLPSAWPHVATGLKRRPGRTWSYLAPNYDVLYDSPLLAGELVQLPSFEVRGVPHHFWAWNPGTFDQAAFIADLQKVVTAAADLIGHIPYEQYVFIGIGPGRGGIEHLNSTTFSFNGAGLAQREERLRMLFFLGHEYFHHYNVKRIRPIELGPFDYTTANRTKSLWMAEGLTVYYEYLIARRAGICTDEEVLNALQKNILAYEDKPGKRHQSLAEASEQTWSDGPFGRTEDEVNKTISYYDKGPVVGWLLDLAIRQATQNGKSLDEVMRILYRDYYQRQERGFTEEEIKSLCTGLTGTPLDELWDYIYTTQDLDYGKYLAYAGLTIDTTWRDVPGGWLGLTGSMRQDSFRLTAVDFDSPAWRAGLRRGQILLAVNQKAVMVQQPLVVLPGSTPGQEITLSVAERGTVRPLSITLGQKRERSFKITRINAPDTQQERIYQSWMKG